MRELFEGDFCKVIWLFRNKRSFIIKQWFSHNLCVSEDLGYEVHLHVVFSESWIIVLINDCVWILNQAFF